MEECWSFFCFLLLEDDVCVVEPLNTQLETFITPSSKMLEALCLRTQEMEPVEPWGFAKISVSSQHIQLNAENSCFVIKCRTFHESDISETEEKTTFEGHKQCVACLRSCQRDSTPRVEICWNTIQIPVLQIFAVCIFWWKMLWSSLSARQDDWQGICKPLSCNTWRKAAAGGGSRCRRPKAPRQHIPWHIAWHMATQSDTDINWDHEIKTRSGWDQDEIRTKSSETNCRA